MRYASVQAHIILGITWIINQTNLGVTWDHSKLSPGTSDLWREFSILTTIKIKNPTFSLRRTAITPKRGSYLSHVEKKKEDWKQDE